MLHRVAVYGFVLLCAPIVGAADSGAQIYTGRCASCHGTRGEGVVGKYPDALIGDRSVGELAKIIAKTMPEDAPGTVVGDDAQRVAAYIHESFYSATARERNRPARVELARLTVRQYRNVVADLVGTFRPTPAPTAERGLRGEYYNARSPRQNNKLYEQRDAEVKFDFGRAGPDPLWFDPREFSIVWAGCVLAPETGEYEFAVRTEHAARLWVNDPRTPLVDAFVKSGSDTDYRASVYLIGGRAYPLKLEFLKSKQGVKDDKKPLKPPAPASITLEWTTPKRAREVIPERNLSPQTVPVVYVVSTSFPPDDRSIGYERGTSVSKAWDSATTDAAIDVADAIAAKADESAGTRENAPDRLVKLRTFVRRFAERAFRRPLSEELVRMYVDRPFETAPTPEDGVRRAVLLALKSPRFLLREVGTGGDGYDVAARLSFALWDSLPDAELLKAAAENRLRTPAQVRTQAERMLADRRTRAKLRGFFHNWLKVDPAPDLAKDAAKFPGFDPSLASDLRASLDLFLDDVVWGDAPPDFRRLLLSEEVFLNGRLAKFYGAELPADAPFRKVTIPGQERAGVLTHPYLLSGFAHATETSPIHRGVFLARSVLGRALKPPQEAFSPLAPDLHPSLTTRQRVALQTAAHACQSCHAIINPLGFTLERYDATGRFRTTENGKPVDPTGGYLTRTGEPLAFRDVRELARFLASSDEAHEAFVEQLFQHIVKQPIRAYGPTRLAELRRAFSADSCDIRHLAVAIAAGIALPETTRPEPKP